MLGRVRTRESGTEAGPGLQERSRPLRTQSRAHHADPMGVGAEAHTLGPTTASHRILRPTSSVAPTKVPQTAGVYYLADPDVRSLQCISWTQTKGSAEPAPSGSTRGEPGPFTDDPNPWLTATPLQPPLVITSPSSGSDPPASSLHLQVKFHL